MDSNGSGDDIRVSSSDAGTTHDHTVAATTTSRSDADGGSTCRGGDDGEVISGGIADNSDSLAFQPPALPSSHVVSDPNSGVDVASPPIRSRYRVLRNADGTPRLVLDDDGHHCENDPRGRRSRGEETAQFGSGSSHNGNGANLANATTCSSNNSNSAPNNFSNSNNKSNLTTTEVSVVTNDSTANTATDATVATTAVGRNAMEMGNSTATFNEAPATTNTAAANSNNSESSTAAPQPHQPPQPNRPTAVRIHLRNPDGTIFTTIPAHALNAPGGANGNGRGNGNDSASANGPGNGNQGMPRIIFRNSSGNIANSPNITVNGVPANVNGNNVTISSFASAMPLPSLEPQPVPHQGHCDDSLKKMSGDDDGGDSKETKTSLESRMKQMKKFECAICFEYMDCPVGCGSCQTRFCHSCLLRVLQQSILSNQRTPQPQQSQPNTDPPNSAKCPHCRSTFTSQSITRDASLLNELQRCTHTIPCPFPGCYTELTVANLKAHEAICPHLKMRCRYAEWGCNWVGKKRDLERHEGGECEFCNRGLGKMVERMRRMDLGCGHLLQQHHVQLHGTNRMLYLQTRWMNMIRGRNAGNIFDVLQLAYEAACFPGRFSLCKDLWGTMLSERERPMVCNSLLLLPSTVLTLRISLQGFQTLSRLRLDSFTGDDVYFYLDSMLLSVITGILGVICLSCFFIDSKNSSSWTTYNIRDAISGQTLRDLVAFSMAMTLFTAIEFFGWHPGILLWHFTSITTILFASFVATMLEKNSNATGLLSSARAWPVVVFGLRYGLLSWCCGLGPSIVAIIACRLGKAASVGSFVRDVPSWVTLEESECFIRQFSVGTLTFGLVAIVSVYTSVAINDSALGILGNLLIAVLVLGYANLFIHGLQLIGKKLAEMSFARRAVQQSTNRIDSGRMLTSELPCPIGISVFAGCSFLLLCISMA